MANGIRTFSGSVNGTMTYFTNNFPTLTALSGTAVWNTTYILIGISSLSFTIPAYNVSNGTQEIRILLSTSASFTSLDINTSNFTDIYGFSDLELESDKVYEISIMPLNANIVTLICKDTGEYFSPLPSGYTRLEYVQSTGTQYINTGYIFKTNSGVFADAQYTSLPTGSNFSYIFGSQYTTSPYRYFTFQGAATASDFRIENGTNNGGGYVSLGAKNTNRHTYSYNYLGDAKVYVDGSALSATATIGSDGTLPIFVTADNLNSSASRFFVGKLYSIKFTEGGVVVRAFIPAIRNSDSAVGLYDLVNSAFYVNSGSGKFSGEGLKTKSLIPTMTSNTAPYGVASCDSYRSGTIGAYGALNGGAWNLDSNCWVAADVAYPHWLQYQFVRPCEISYVQIGRTDVYCPKNFILQGSNDGTTWTNLTESLTMSSYTSLNTIFVTKNKGKYSYVRLYCTSSFQGSSATNTLAINYFQAYED